MAAADTSERTYGIETAVNVTPSDTVDLSIGFTRGIYVGGTGALRVKMLDGGVIAFPRIVGGSIMPLCVSRVLSTGTTATNIIALK
jgi:hypothetical protein